MRGVEGGRASSYPACGVWAWGGGENRRIANACAAGTLRLYPRGCQESWRSGGHVYSWLDRDRRSGRVTLEEWRTYGTRDSDGMDNQDGGGTM